LPLDIEITDLIYQGSLLFIPTDSEGFWVDTQLVYQKEEVPVAQSKFESFLDKVYCALKEHVCPHCGYKY